MPNRHSLHSHPRSRSETKPVTQCPYCQGTDIIKAGKRQKRLETIQVYFCKHCQKKFTPLISKHKTYPVAVIIKSLIDYNRFLTPGQISQKHKRQSGLTLSPKTIQNWVTQYQDCQPFLRMRKILEPQVIHQHLKTKDLILQSRLFHNQVYDFKYHRAKADLLTRQDPKNQKLKPIQDFLEQVIQTCPHKLFRQNPSRSSKFKNLFNLDHVRITRKANKAREMTNFVIQAVAANKQRHPRLQDFMLACDSTTIAVEVPVYLTPKDLAHFKAKLKFQVPLHLKPGEVITGHIDFIQIRNGLLHILDYKPKAQKEKPIEQLTIYALALSRLTGLRLFDFKCAWFDEDNYYEFYPLHVVYKKTKPKP